MPHRRDVLAQGIAAALTGALWPRVLHALPAVHRALDARDGVPPDALATDEDFWTTVAQAFVVDGRYIVLNGGGQNPPTRATVDALVRGEQLAAAQPRPNNLQLVGQIEQHRMRLARALNASPGDIALTRNTTEGLHLVINGLSFARDDEIVVSPYEEVYAEVACRVRVARDGVRVIRAAVEPGASDDAIVAAFERALSPRTRLMICSHIADAWGYVLPIARLSAVARRAGVPLLCDGALSFAHVPVDVQALGCDYYATSLHKWLGAPLGTGLLYVKQDRLASLWPTYGSNLAATDIRKLEVVGTRPGAPIAAIGQALDFHEAIGSARKAARLRHLLSLALTPLRDVRAIRVYTDADPTRRGSLARFTIDGWTGERIATALRERYGIYTFGGMQDAVGGIYIAPNLFNLPHHIERFVTAMREIAAARPPA
ncbi:MAG: aminotransferase class V-fold PLP-dependent enzyme [Gemmatimonadaceae bacterium]|jgi:selenocysteine lyase/cysteine desulfurase|nr:aminotransferase class V-fold PLP-dependent enzyme [Gemmatimonadaceae bacterium]